MSVYGAVSNGVRIFQEHQRRQTDIVNDLAQAPFDPANQEELTARILKMDRAKQNLDYGNSVVEEVLKNLSQLQP